MKLIYALLLVLCMSFVVSDNTKEQEKTFIKEMCGCYEVNFQYAETFSPSKDYEFKDRYDARGLEWIFTDEETEDKLVLQHLLIVNDTMVIKHWRQDWLYENQEILSYQRNHEWKKEQHDAKEVAGTWTQKVYQVDDSPRYEGFAHWVNMDGKKYWESTVIAPLPRREHTKRSDYNVMQRNNKHKITSYGHVHELDNAKIIRTEEKDSILVWEKGMNTYTKVDDSRCKKAQDWWPSNRAYWTDVRAVWTDVIAEHNYINITKKIEDKRLSQHLFALNKELVAKKKYNSKAAQKQIRELIDMYLTDKPSAWTTETAQETKAY